MKELNDAGSLCYGGGAAVYRNQYEYQELLYTCYDKNWVTDIRESFVGAENVMHYLGRYTHRIAIRIRRILRMDETMVTIWVKDYKCGVEFIRCFLMYVPLKGFIRIRYYDLLSNHNKRKLIPICRNLTGCSQDTA